MRALIDTNVVLDFICKRDGFFDEANRVFQHCFTDVDGLIAGHTICNLFYILQNRYSLSLEQCRIKIRNLCALFDVAAIGKETILAALDDEHFSDMEDALQYECALCSAADCIVTRNTQDFAGATIPVLTPKEFLLSLRQ